MNHPSIAAVILAAGASRRMGSPKALLTWEGETFLDRLARLSGAVCRPVVAVIGFDAGAIRPGIQHPERLLLVENPQPERGQLSSLQTGLTAVPAGAGGVLFTPVDQPAVRAATIERLVTAFQSRPREVSIVVPRFEGRHGHPVCVGPDVVAELLALPPATGQAREVIHRIPGRVAYLDVEDAGVVTDIDDPDAYRALLQQGTRCSA